jgi:predicted DNA-binding transcriptional regulator YafY
MSRDTTADARLERLLYVLPAAMRQEGAGLGELARALDTTEQRILEDLEEVTSRIYYRPGGWPDDVLIQIESGRVRVQRASGFERPPQLSREELLCLALALRGTAAAAYLDKPDLRRCLLERAEAHLGRTVDGADAEPSIKAPDLDADPEGIREMLMTAARDRRPCAIWYAKAGAADGSVRVVHPYAIACGEGSWYAIAHCAVEDAVRVFRMDRILAADLADGTFDVPEDFDAAQYVDHGRVYHASEEREVQVRYSARIAPWIGERMRWEPERVSHSDNGDLVVRHRVADPHWVVGHVLLYGGEAEIVGPRELRGVVGEVGRR